MMARRLVVLVSGFLLFSSQAFAQGSYVGCYQDQGARDLAGATFAAGNMSAANCQNYCREKGFKFAATQYGSHCFCGNAYGKYGKVDEARCDMRCSGNAAEKCGGSWANSVYALSGSESGTVIFPGGRRYTGCFEDRANRDLSGATFAAGTMSAARCDTFCRDKGFRFAATQYGAHCFCGNAHGKYGRVDDSRCNMGCSGNPGEKCGGSWANSVYELLAGERETTPSRGGKQYVGCFGDSASRDLGGATFAAGTMSAARCETFCREKGFKFAATQYGAHCFCGNDYGKYGKVDESRCNMGCSGDPGEKCGGAWANSIYRLD